MNHTLRYFIWKPISNNFKIWLFYAVNTVLPSVPKELKLTEYTFYTFYPFLHSTQAMSDI